MFKKATTLAAVCGSLLAGSALADTIQLTGVIRDFKRGDWSGGHPDFQTAGMMGAFGHVKNLVSMDLNEDGKPVYNPVRPSSKDTINSAQSLAQWFSDVPDVNLSQPLTLTLDNGKSTPGGVYSYSSNSFWPINNQMFGNQSLDKNFHFTFELRTKFTYVPGQYFTFIGDDDVWVYVNSKRVIDLGGVHPAITGSVLLFDGKAFVEKSHFSTGGDVQRVTSSMASQFATKWASLGLPGSCPIRENDKFIDLDLNDGGADVRAQYNSTKKSVTAYTSDSLSSVSVIFEDGTEQTFDGLSGSSNVVAGTGDHHDKIIRGIWIKTASDSGEGKGVYLPATGGSSVDANLDFFFAESHTTQSNFRIDTSMNLVEVPPTTISPLYD